MHVIDIFDEIHSKKSIDECLKITEEKDLIVIECLPWLLLRTSEGNLFRILNNWSSKNIKTISQEVYNFFHQKQVW